MDDPTREHRNIDVYVLGFNELAVIVMLIFLCAFFIGKKDIARNPVLLLFFCNGFILAGNSELSDYIESCDYFSLSLIKCYAKFSRK